jgi:hypothetical protein
MHTNLMINIFLAWVSLEFFFCLFNLPLLFKNYKNTIQSKDTSSKPLVW